jgi:DNA modification methylase/superfamily II DNA or RNA helicase
MKYSEFLKSKAFSHVSCGFLSDLSSVDWLFGFQRTIVEKCLKRGKAAIFADTGLGKARMGLAWADRISTIADCNVLILTPCAVAQQMAREAEKIGIAVNIISESAEVKDGISICNYEKLHKLDSADFGAIVLDESSILKGFTSKYRAALTDFAAGMAYRLAMTATPSPNDLIELINHSDWLGVMRGREAIANFFVQDGNTTKKYRLKKTCEDAFWQWVASWAVCVKLPSDLGDYSNDGYSLPPLNLTRLEVASGQKMTSLLPVNAMSLTERREARKASLTGRVAAVAELVNGSDKPWVIWCDYNDESNALKKAIPDAVEVRGSLTIEQKEKAIDGFSDGSVRVLITKPSITGFGLNWQHCHNTAFVGVSDSFEQQYQAIRRFHRFGQTETVNVYAAASIAEFQVMENITRKQDQHNNFYAQVSAHMKSALNGIPIEVKASPNSGKIFSGKKWELRLGDNVERLAELADDSIDLSITSIPFPGMYAYTDLPGDMGNVRDYDEFFNHFDYLLPQWLRVTKPGRTACVHVTDGVAMVSREGHMGLKDFSGDTIRAFQKNGWLYAGKVFVDQDPQLEAVRNNTHGLLFKSLATDASIMRFALADYVLLFRKPGDNEVPIKAGKSSKYNQGGGWITEEEWIEWAAPVWYRHVAPDGKIAQSQPYHPALQRQAMMSSSKNGKSFNGIMDTDVANVGIARDPSDERHLCLAKGSLILTKSGYKPIESIGIGDLVLTHMGRWMPVIAKQCTGLSEVVQVKAQGVANLVLTPDHKLWTRNGIADKSRKKAMSSEPGWVESAKTVGSYVNLKLPPIENDCDYTTHEWKIIGRWLADGHIHIRNDDGRSTAFISYGDHKSEELMLILGDYAGAVSKTHTANQVRIKDVDGRLRSMIAKCGHGAANKHLPPEAYTLPVAKAKALLDGYLSGDGHYVKSREKWTASSVSRELLLGMAMLVQRTFGTVASVYAGRKPGTSVIQGRTVNTQQDWIMCFNESLDSSAFIADDGAWKRVRSADPADAVETWSLQVAEDASYTAEGCIVKNCPLQYGIIERCAKLFSNPGELIMDPFNGVGSTGIKALEIERRYTGLEIKESYVKTAVKYLKKAEAGTMEYQSTIFDALIAA